MGQSPYHKRMIEHIFRYGKERKDRYINAHQGSVTPLYLSHPQTKRKKIPPIQYEPDVYFIAKKKNKIIFEVLDSEWKKTSELISDMIQCCIASEITYLIFIIPVNDDETEYRIFDIYSVITDTLIHLGINEDWIPDFAIYYILPKESLSYKKVKTILSQLSKSDKW